MRKLIGNKSVIRTLMENSVWFKSLPASMINDLILKSEFREYAKGEIIHRDFDKNELIFIVSGSVWTCLIGLSIDLKFGVLLPSSLIGLSELLADQSTEVPFFDFKAAEDCHVLAIPTAVFINALESNTHLWRLMTESIIRYHRRCIRLVVGMYTGPIKNRIISAIHHFCIASLDDQQSTTPIVIDLTQEGLSILIKSSRQHVNKALSLLEEEHLLRVGYKKIEILNPAEFSTIARSLMPPLQKLYAP